jgi:hypothetical protein
MVIFQYGIQSVNLKNLPDSLEIDSISVVPLRKELVIIDAELLNRELSMRVMFIYS